MRDNELIAILRSTIIAQEAIAGIEDTPIKQAFQPTNQGVNTVPTAYLQKIGNDRRVGSPMRSDEWNTDLDVMIHTEIQQYESTFQISTLATQNPATPEKYTASDILNLIAYILQSENTIVALNEAGIGILKASDTRNPYFIDDRARFEANPSFDFTLTHKQIISNINRVLKATELQILPV